MIDGINHYNLRADEETIEVLKDFYIEIVGLKLGHRPPFRNGGYWLYANQKDVLHLSFSKNGIVNELNVNSTFDHMAFTCQDENKHIDLLTKKNIKFSCALVFALSIGDLGVIVLFSGNDIGTLPMYLYRLIGSYRMDEAYFVSMILLLLAFISFWLIENGNLNVFKRKQMSD